MPVKWAKRKPQKGILKEYETLTKEYVEDKDEDKESLGRWGGPARDLLPNTSVPFS